MDIMDLPSFNIIRVKLYCNCNKKKEEKLKFTLQHDQK